MSIIFLWKFYSGSYLIYLLYYNYYDSCITSFNWCKHIEIFLNKTDGDDYCCHCYLISLSFMAVLSPTRTVVLWCICRGQWHSSAAIVYLKRERRVNECTFHDQLSSQQLIGIAQSLAQIESILENTRNRVNNYDIIIFQDVTVITWYNLSISFTF